MPGRRGRRSVLQAETLEASYQDRHRTKRLIDSPIGTMRELEKVGVRKSHLTLRPRGPVDEDRTRRMQREYGPDYVAHEGPRYSTGERAQSEWLHVAATASALKPVVRQLRQQEASQLADLDEQIRSAQQRVRELKAKRDVVCRDAFSRGHVVPVKDLIAKADVALAKTKTPTG